MVVFEGFMLFFVALVAIASTIAAILKCLDVWTESERPNGVELHRNMQMTMTVQRNLSTRIHQLDAVQRELDTVQDRMDAMGQDLEAMQGRKYVLQNCLAALQRDVDGMQCRMKMLCDLENRIGRLEKKVGTLEIES